MTFNQLRRAFRFGPRRQSSRSTLQWIEYARGFVIFGTNFAVGVTILISGLTGRLQTTPSWNAMLSDFPMSYGAWSSMLIVTGFLGIFSVLGPEWTRLIEVVCAGLAGCWYFLMTVVSLYVILIESHLMFMMPVIWFNFSVSSTIRAITQIKTVA